MYLVRTSAYDSLMPEDQKDISPRAEVLREAEQLITGDRNETYGPPTKNFENIAKLWNVQFQHLLAEGSEFTAADVALAMIHMKMARMVAQPKRDNFVDLAGYAACGWECIETGEAEDAVKPLTGVVKPQPWDSLTRTAADYRYTINVSNPRDDRIQKIRVNDSQHKCGPCC